MEKAVLKIVTLRDGPSPSAPPSEGPVPRPSGMSSTTLEDGLTCSVCLDCYTEEERRPLMLPACGHTFCRLCLAGIVARERSNFLCPSCRRSQPVYAVQDLPVNYSLLHVIRRSSLSPTSPTHSTLSRLPQQQELCPEHSARLGFWCRTCEEAVCGECLFERHPGKEHQVVRIQDQMAGLKEMVKIRSSRVVTQLAEVSEENMTEVKLEFLSLVEHLRQRRAIDKLLKEARQARSRAKGAEDLPSITAVHQTIVEVQREFERAHITTPSRLTVVSLASKVPDGPQADVSRGPANPRAPEDALSFSEDPQMEPKAAAEGQAWDTPPVNTRAKPDLPPKTALGTSWAKRDNPSSPADPAEEQQGTETQSTQTAASWVRRPLETLEWENGVCGVLSGSWTSSKVTLEPRGIHVYSLKPLKDKCDLFLNLSVVYAAIPLESPVVFLDLEDDCRSLGRVYITLQISFFRAKQFLCLCLGDRGPSFAGSCFHSVTRKGNSGEGLVGGDYECKGGKGGAAIFKGAEGMQMEVPKRCERGMVIGASSRAETATQFCISVKDGPRSKTVLPFGRVCHGLGVVEAACRRPASSVRVSDCGLVLPL